MGKEERVIRTIYQKLNDIMKEVDYIQKGEKKAVIGPQQYRFVSHDKVTARLHEPLTRHGIVALPTVKERKQDGNRTEVLLEVKFINVENPSDFITVDYLGYGIDGGDKGPGKAISYAFKYALLKVFCLETGDDPDENQDTVYELPVISKEQFDQLDFALQDDEDAKGKILQRFSIKNINELKANDFQRIMGWLSSRKERSNESRKVA